MSIDIDSLAENHYSSSDPAFDNSELEECPGFEDEEWTQICEDAGYVTKSINTLLNLAEAMNDPVLINQARRIEKRFYKMKGDMKL